MKLKDLVKIAAPVAVGAFAGPLAGTALQSAGLGSLAASPFARSAIASGLGSVLFGQKPKDALRSALLGGIGGMAFGQATPAAEVAQTTAVTPSVAGMNPAIQKRVLDEAATRSATTSGIGAFQGTAPAAGAQTMSGELLKSAGFAGEDEGNLLFRLLNTKLGEGVAAGLVAQLLAGDEEEIDSRGSFERRPYGAGGPGGQLGGINYMADGGEPDYFPRRNGGIDPAEGSGTKDDVPAMLMAGEFVMTRDAVKGAGGGNLRKGIDRMYNMMDDFERMA